MRRLRRLVEFHRHALEVLAEAISIDLLWTLLRVAGVFGAGWAAAAITSSTSPPLARVAVPARLALETPTQKLIVREGLRYGPDSGIVYVWGGSSPFGFDCSGFVQYVHKRADILIPRDSRSQWTSLQGIDVPKGHEQPGDAVYFDGGRAGANAGPPPGHEGLYIGGGKFIEYYSSGLPARVALLRDEPGYMGAKRWWQPLTVAKTDAGRVFWFARHFHARISAASRRNVTFRPWRGHGRFAHWKYRLMLRWTRNHHHRVNSDRSHHYLQIHLG